jgi:hypothetical protein
MKRSQLPNPTRFLRGMPAPSGYKPPRHPIIEYKRGVPNPRTGVYGVRVTAILHQAAFGVSQRLDPSASQGVERPAPGSRVPPLSDKLRRYVTQVLSHEEFAELPVCEWRLDHRGHITDIREVLVLALP